MQLQKRLNRKIGDKEYSKWQIVIPPEKIEELGWKEGEELFDEVKGNKLVLSPKSNFEIDEETRKLAAKYAPKRGMKVAR